MHQKIIFLLLFSISAGLTRAQTCVHKELSLKLIFTTRIQRIKTDNDHYSNVITVTIIAKPGGKTIQTLQYTAGFLLDDAFTNCRFVRSYTTGKNVHSEAVDNDYGDIIIADFNFDGREDIGVKNESGGGSGPVYNYYIQDKRGMFSADRFLADSVSYFPSDFNRKSKTLTTRVIAGAHYLDVSSFQLNTLSGKWSRINKKMIRVG